VPEVLLKSRSFREAMGYGNRARRFTRTRAAVPAAKGRRW
jgi:hypothetical protein